MLRELGDIRDFADSPRRNLKFNKLGMKYVREGFDAFGETRAGSREISIGIEGEDASVAYGRHRLPRGRKLHRGVFRCSLSGIIAAGHHENYFRRGSDNVFHIYMKRAIARTC